MKKGAQGLEDIKATSFYGQFFKEFVFLVTSLKVCHISVYILLIFCCKSNSICNLFSLRSTFCHFFLISVVRYCTSWSCRVSTYPWLYQFQILLPLYLLQSQAGSWVRRKCTEVSKWKIIFVSLENVMNSLLYKMLWIHYFSVLFSRYLFGNDAYTMWDYIVLLGQTE